MSDAARHDGRYLRELVAKTNTASTVWADTAYRSRRNEAWLIRNGLFSKVHHRRAPGKALPDKLARANAARSKVRSSIEHVFAHQKARMGLFVRTIGIARARLKIGMANLVYNMQRLVWFEGRTAPA